MNTKQLLKQMSESVGVVGYENNTALLAKEILSNYTDDVTIDDFGNVIANIKPKKEGGPHIMLDAHIDEIGMMVTSIDENGFIKVAACGGVDRRILLAQRVTVCGTNGELTGIVASKPPHLEKGEDANKIPEIDEMLIDVGLTKKQVEEKVCFGDRVVVKTEFREMLNDMVAGKCLDDRSGCVALMKAVDLLKDKEFDCGLTILLSTREEIGSQGAKVAAYNINPDYAVCVDVSFGFGVDIPEHKCGKMGEGALICPAAVLDKQVSDKLIQIAKDKNIPYQIEILTGRTSTTADNISLTRGGVKTGLISIPLRYMHTAVETISIKDVEYVANLLAEYVLEVGGKNV